MSIVAVSIEPGAQDRAFASELADALHLDLVDLRSFERSHATAVDASADPVTFPAAPFRRTWYRPGRSEMAARLRELTLDTAARENVLIVGWCAPAILRSIPHVVTVKVSASVARRAAVLKAQMRYPHIGTAYLELESQDALIARHVRLTTGNDWRSDRIYDLLVRSDWETNANCVRRIRRCAWKTPSERRVVQAAIERQLDDIHRQDLVSDRLRLQQRMSDDAQSLG